MDYQKFESGVLCYFGLFFMKSAIINLLLCKIFNKTINCQDKESGNQKFR